MPADALLMSVGLEVLSAAASLPGGPGLLLRQGGLLTWASGAAAAAMQQLQQLQQQHQQQGGQRGRHGASAAAAGSLPKRTVGVLQSILALCARAVQGFVTLHQHEQHEQQQQQQQQQPVGPSAVADQARAFVPALLLLLLRAGLLPPARPRPGTAAARHAPAALLSLASAVLDLLLLLQQQLLPSLGLVLPQALVLMGAVGAAAAPAEVLEGLQCQLLTLIVREAAADKDWGAVQTAGSDARSLLFAWLAQRTVGLLRSSGDEVQALVISTDAGRLALRLLQHLPTTTTAETARTDWRWTLVGVLSCPVFLPGTLTEAAAAASAVPARCAAKAAWVEVALHLLISQEDGEGTLLRELAAALQEVKQMKTQQDGEAAATATAVLDVVGSAVRALLGGGKHHDMSQLRSDTRAALAPLMTLPSSADGEGARTTTRRAAAAAATAAAERGRRAGSKRRKQS